MMQMDPEMYLKVSRKLFGTDLSFIGMHNKFEFKTPIKMITLDYEGKKYVIHYATKDGHIFEELTCDYLNTAITMITAERDMDRRAVKING